MKRFAVTLAALALASAAAFAQSDDPRRSPSLSIPAEAGGVYGAGGEKAIDARFTTKHPMSLEQPVDPQTYVLGPGDELGISLRGGVDGFFRLRINPDGTLIVPLAAPIRLEGMVLADAKKKLTSAMKESFPSATVDVVLLDLRRFRVTIAGAVSKTGIFEATQADRPTTLVEAAGGLLTERSWQTRFSSEMQSMMVSWDEFASRKGPFPEASMRNATLHRKDGSTQRVDLLRYQRTGEEKYNPTLFDGDRLVIAYKSEHVIPMRVSGAVTLPCSLEWVPGDHLMDALALAGGVLAEAAGDSVRLTRYNENGHNRETLYSLSALQSGDGKGPELQPGDLVYVKPRADRPRSTMVELNGEVMFPGSYPIVAGETTLRDIIERAGGFTSYAHIDGSVIRRQIPVGGIRKVEERRVDRVVDNMLGRKYKYIEPEYLKFSVRWQGYDRVAADFNEIFMPDEQRKNKEHPPVLLQHGDIIDVPSVELGVLVMGQVGNPGRYPYNPDWDYKDYIKAAGGYGSTAKKSWVRWVPYESAAWQVPSGKSEVGPGDMLFVPETPIGYDWELIQDMMLVASQAATVILVIFTMFGN